MADLPLPSAANCLTPLIDSLVANEPKRLDHINYGVGKWSNALAGWKAQATLNLRRVADEMMQARLTLANGRGLRELASSKFFASIVDTPTAAVGQAQINPLTTPSPGTVFIIPKGTRFRRSANPKATPVALPAADYVSTAEVRSVWGSVNYNPISIPIACTSVGLAGNIVLEAGFDDGAGVELSLIDPIYDQNGIQTPFPSMVATCAGGGVGFSDDEVRAIAGAQPQGRRGPTDGAILAGALLALGVRHAAIFTNLTTAQTVLFAADESWASDVHYWQPAVIQALIGDGKIDAWAGFGCAINPSGVGQVDNTYLHVVATVQLRSRLLLQQTEDVKAKIRKKLVAYFDGRPDWYTFRASAVRGVIARADPRILTCSTVTITDRFGTLVPDPASIPYGTAPSSLTHYSLLSFLPTFTDPT